MHCQVSGIAVIKFIDGVKLGVTHRRSVRANSGRAAQPVAVNKRLLKVCRMRAVDHESRCGIGQ
jgi:hypothetical protein